jgi:predicted nucleotidyltransferase
MELLQIDSLSNLKNNQGFWDNFVWPLLLAIVIGSFVLFRNKIFTKRNKKEISENLPVQEEGVNKFFSFQELCQHVLPLLIENNYIFRTYGPNSSANETEPLRTDLKLWKQARVDYIIPNNDRIAELIETNTELVPAQHEGLFRKLQSHIYAFKKHVENENFDYSEFQFPKEVDKLVKETCFQKVQQEEYFIKTTQYLSDKLDDGKIEEVVLFGSFLFYSNGKNDIDLVILLRNNIDTQQLKLINKKLEELKSKFLKKFKKRLHLTIFTQREIENYRKFLNFNEYKLKVYG